MNPTANELRKLRLQPHQSEVNLSIYVPPIILACLVNSTTIEKGAVSIPYDTVTSGNFVNVLSGMTILVGTSLGSSDQGRLRVRSIVAGVISVAENDDVDWRDNLFLTIIGFFEPWSVFPRITLDDDNIPTFFKDYDITYDENNSKFDPLVNMGPNHAAFITATGSIGVYYSASGTQDLSDGGGIASYNWFFEGGTPTGSTSAVPGDIQYATGGHYTTRLQVTSTLGKAFTAYRHISIYDKPGEGDSLPISNWGIRDFNGSRSDGGWRISFWVRQVENLSQIVDGALIVLFSEDRYGTEEGALGGNAANRQSILFSGYVDGETIEYDAQTSLLTFTALSITRVMGDKQTFGTSLEDKVDAFTWTEMVNMTVDKAALHFLRWHSTVLTVADLSLTGDLKAVQYIDFDRTNLQAALSGLYESTIDAQVVSDRQGKIFAEIEANLIPSGSRAGLDINMELERKDWLGSVSFPRMQSKSLAFVEVGGVAYSGLTSGTAVNSPFLSQAPGVAPSYTGNFKRTTGRVVTSQVFLNALAGRIWADENLEFPSISINLAGNYRNFDIAPQSIIPITLNPADTYRQLTWRSKHFILDSIGIDLDHNKASLTMTIEMKSESWGDIFGTTIAIPIIPPFDLPDLPDFDLDFPPIIPPPIEFPPIGGFNPNNKGGTVYICFKNAIARTRNFWDPSPNWENITPTWDAPVVQDIRGFSLFHGDPENSAMITSKPLETYITANLDSATPAWGVDLSAANAVTIGGLHATQHEVMNTVQQWGGDSFIVLTKARAIEVDQWPSIFYRRNGVWSAHQDFPPSVGGQSNQSIGADPYGNGGGTIMFCAEGGPYSLRASFNGGGKYQETMSAAEVGDLISGIVGVGGSGFLYTLVDGLNSEKRLYYTADGGETRVGYYPIYNGRTWGTTHLVPSTRQMGIDYNVQTGELNAVLQGTGGGDVLFQSAGPPAPWTAVHSFLGLVTQLRVNPANPDLMYAFGNISDGYILGSQDHGTAWYNKTGDFQSAVMSIAAAGAPIKIMPVWTVD